MPACEDRVKKNQILKSVRSWRELQCKELTPWKTPWCWERLRAGGEGGDRGWDGWMASLTEWTWIWANSRRWWRTGKPGMLQSMGSQRVRRDWVTKQQQQHKGKEKDKYKNNAMLCSGGCSYPKSHVWDRKKIFPCVLRMRISKSWKSQLTKYIWMNFLEEL